MAHLFLGMLALADDDYGAAKDLLKEAANLHKSIGQRDEWALAIAPLSHAARAQGDMARAGKYVCQALQTGAELRAFGLVITPVPAAALLLADTGEAELAAEIHALARRHPYVATSRFYEDIVGKQITTVAASLPPDVVAAAQELGRARNLWATAKALVDGFKITASKACASVC